VADARLGEKVCLAIVACEGTSVDAHELLRHLHTAGLSKYDMPEFFIAMEAFPLTASGKILKRELAEWARAGRLAPQAVRFVEPEQEGAHGG
jgi:acyl-CoA synthetase